jgi:hypothetical protein
MLIQQIDLLTASKAGIHMWTAPGSQGVGSAIALVDCGHMSGPPLSRGQAFVVRSS